MLTHIVGSGGNRWYAMSLQGGVEKEGLINKTKNSEVEHKHMSLEVGGDLHIPRSMEVGGYLHSPRSK